MLGITFRFEGKNWIVAKHFAENAWVCHEVRRRNNQRWFYENEIKELSNS